MNDHKLFTKYDIVLLNYNQRTIQRLSRKINMTNAYCYRLITKLIDYGLLIKEKKGRRVELHLTPKGKIVYSSLKKIEWTML